MGKNIMVKPIGNIAKYDFITPSLYFKDKVNDNHHDILYERSKTIEKKTLFIKEFDHKLDGILLHYLFFSKNITAIVVWPISNIILNKDNYLYKKLAKSGTIHAVKKITLSSKQMFNLFYQLYYSNKHMKTLDKLKKKQLKCHANNKVNIIQIVFYETEKKINGNNADFKQELRLSVQKRVSIKASSTAFLHATDNFTEMIELAKIVCNLNSVNFLERQNIAKMLEDKETLKKLLSFKDNIYDLSLFNQELILFSDKFVSFSLGSKKDDQLIIYQQKNILNQDKIVKTNNKIDYFNPLGYYYYLGIKFHNK